MSQSEALTITIPSTYCGPPDSGNGGYVCGRLAAYIDGVAEVTLQLPPPLETPLVIEQIDSQVKLWDGKKLVAEARPSTLEMEAPSPPDWEATEAAVPRYAGFRHHVFPTCFVCGPQRGKGDGLRIFAGAVEGSEMVASPWVPDVHLAGENGQVRSEYIWASLDCPGAFAVGDRENPVVLGRMTARIDHPVWPGKPYRVIGWVIESAGRKAIAGTALFAEDDTLCAVAKAVWIELSSS